jgi:hypothetical protein
MANALVELVLGGRGGCVGNRPTCCDENALC